MPRHGHRCQIQRQLIGDGAGGEGRNLVDNAISHAQHIVGGNGVMAAGLDRDKAALTGEVPCRGYGRDHRRLGQRIPSPQGQGCNRVESRHDQPISPNSHRAGEGNVAHHPHHAGIRAGDHSDRVPAEVGDVDVAGCVRGQPPRVGKAVGHRQPAILPVVEVAPTTKGDAAPGRFSGSRVEPSFRVHHEIAEIHDPILLAGPPHTPQTEAVKTPDVLSCGRIHLESVVIRGHVESAVRRVEAETVDDELRTRHDWGVDAHRRRARFDTVDALAVGEVEGPRGPIYVQIAEAHQGVDACQIRSDCGGSVAGGLLQDAEGLEVEPDHGTDRVHGYGQSEDVIHKGSAKETEGGEMADGGAGRATAGIQRRG
jgi:hypothetical protein